MMSKARINDAIRIAGAKPSHIDSLTERWRVGHVVLALLFILLTLAPEADASKRTTSEDVVAYYSADDSGCGPWDLV